MEIVDRNNNPMLTRPSGIHTTHGGGVRFPIQVGDVQMALVAESTKGKAMYHLGLQNSLS